jgi:YD repeat-containing protein
VIIRYFVTTPPYQSVITIISETAEGRAKMRNAETARYPLSALADLLVVGALLVSASLYAYNKPWDQGHDGTNPSNPNNPNNPPNPPNNPHGGSGSPVYIKSGSFMQVHIDLTVQACGKPMKITRFYNSADESSGIFGNGWTLGYGMRLLPTQESDGTEYVLALMSNGQRYRFTRNSDGTFTPPPGTIFTLTMDRGDYVLKDNLELSYRFGSDGFLTHMSDRGGSTLSFSYQLFGGCFDKISDESNRVFQFTFGANGKVASISDPVGNSVIYEYDQSGNLIVFTDSEGGRWQYGYDATNKLTSVKNPNNETVTTVTYEAGELHRVLTYSDRGETFRLTYQSANQTNKQNSLNRTVQYQFLDNGLITKKTSPLGFAIQHGYDASYNYTSFTDQNNHVTAFSYDAAKNLTGVRDASSAATTLIYDSDGNVLSISDPLGRTAQFVYSSTSSDLTQIARAGSGDIAITYDGKGYLQSINYPGGESLAFERDMICNLKRILSSSGKEIAIAYDGLGNPTSITSPSGTQLIGYNKTSHITSVTDGTGTTHIGYDATGRITQVVEPDGTTFQMSHNGTLQKITQTKYPDNSTFSYDYYSFDRLKTLTFAPGSGPGTSWAKQFGYDADERLTTVTLPSAATITYSYDPAGNVTGIQDSSLGVAITLGYNAANRVSSIDSANYTDSFFYNEIGNRIKKRDNAGVETVYNYDARDGLTGVSTLGVTTTFPAPVRKLPSTIMLSDVIGLYNSRQNLRLLSYLVAFTPDELIAMLRYDLQYHRLALNGIEERQLTGFRHAVLPQADTFAVPQILTIFNFVDQYRRLGAVWQP